MTTRTLQVLARALLVLMLVAAGGAMAAASVPRLLGYETLVILSGSMGHTAPVGGIVLGRSVHAEDVQQGDVVLLHRQGAESVHPPVLHRVIALERRDGDVVVRTQGDANPHPDPQPYVLRGRVTTLAHVLPVVGYAVRSVSTRTGWILLVVLPMTVQCTLRLRAIWAAPDPRRAQREHPRADAVPGRT